MATTSNYIQWPTHKRKAAQRKRSRKAIMRGVISGKAQSTLASLPVAVGTESPA